MAKFNKSKKSFSNEKEELNTSISKTKQTQPLYEVEKILKKRFVNGKV